jgi:hypothetical protein
LSLLAVTKMSCARAVCSRRLRSRDHGMVGHYGWHLRRDGPRPHACLRRASLRYPNARTPSSGCPINGSAYHHSRYRGRPRSALVLHPGPFAGIQRGQRSLRHNPQTRLYSPLDPARCRDGDRPLAKMVRGLQRSSPARVLSATCYLSGQTGCTPTPTTYAAGPSLAESCKACRKRQMVDHTRATWRVRRSRRRAYAMATDAFMCCCIGKVG